MTVLIVILCIILFFAMLLISRAKLFFLFSDGKTQVFLKYLFFRYDLTDKEVEKINLSDFKISRFRRRRDKVLKKYKLAHAEKKKSDQDKKESQANENDTNTESSEKKVKFNMALLKDLLVLVGRVFPRCLSVRVKTLMIGVGGKEADDIALKTAAMLSLTQYTVSAIGEVADLQKTKDAQVEVLPMYADGKWHAQINVMASIRLGAVLRLGISLLIYYLKNILFKKKVKS